jgi:hypothetical protein
MGDSLRKTTCGSVQKIGYGFAGTITPSLVEQVPEVNKKN